jgi:superfamily II DNA or RNA helicase
LQETPSTEFRPGERVRVRAREWNIVEVTPYEDCRTLTLLPAGADSPAPVQTLILPFDRPVRLHRIDRPRAVRWTRCATALAATVASRNPADGLLTAADARIDLRSFQLEPALAAVRGHATRFLLADDVGLGKTVQAGLLVSELRARGRASRVLVLTPAGLRAQWAEELATRFDLNPEIADPDMLRRRLRLLPRGANPWAMPGIVIASLDLVKRCEVLQGLKEIAWDVFVVDEAHGATPASDRGKAVHLLARQARTVVLVSATPHAGDDRAFDWLCGLGRLDPAGADPILMFRRRRVDVGMTARRRSTLLFVRLNPAEQRMHRLLERYVRTVWRIARREGRADSLLAMTVLVKRSLSSAGSLARSVQRRLDCLGRLDEHAQLALPLDEDDGRDDQEPGWLLGAPGLADAQRERAWLAAIGEAASKAARRESKVDALVRLVRRAREPVLVFTEYRDTLQEMVARLSRQTDVAVLHGGLSPDERRAAIHRFTAGGVAVLVATDVGAEGLNLQARCRLVLSLELPWNPARLQQRMGRVDRIGQVRTVHGVHLVGKHTAEGDILVRIVRRLERTGSALGEIDPILGRLTPETLAAAMVTRSARLEPAFPRPAARTRHRASRSDATNRLFTLPSPHLGAGAVRENERLDLARRIRIVLDRRHRRVDIIARELDRRAPWISIARRLGLRIALPELAGGILSIYGGRIVDGLGRTLERPLLPLLVSGPARVIRSARSTVELTRLVERLLAAYGSDLGSLARQEIQRRSDALAAGHRADLERRRHREELLWRHLHDRPGHEPQLGLFGRRRVAGLAESIDETWREARDDHAAALRHAATLSCPDDPDLLFCVLG